MRNTRSGRHGPRSFMVSSMFEFLIGVVTRTPVWVWVLFIFLISRGLKARRPATVTLERLAIIPGIFLIWDIYDLIVYRTLTPGTVALWTAGIFAGASGRDKASAGGIGRLSRWEDVLRRILAEGYD